MPPQTTPTTMDLIKKHCNDKYFGRRDIEVADSIDFCENFAQKYGDGPGMTRLKSKCLKLEQNLRNAIS